MFFQQEVDLAFPILEIPVFRLKSVERTVREISETAVFQTEVFDIADILRRQFFSFGNDVAIPEPAAGAIPFEIFIDGIEQPADISGGEGDFSFRTFVFFAPVPELQYIRKRTKMQEVRGYGVKEPRPGNGARSFHPFGFQPVFPADRTCPQRGTKTGRRPDGFRSGGGVFGHGILIPPESRTALRGVRTILSG